MLVSGEGDAFHLEVILIQRHWLKKKKSEVMQEKCHLEGISGPLAYGKKRGTPDWDRALKTEKMRFHTAAKPGNRSRRAVFASHQRPAAKLPYPSSSCPRPAKGTVSLDWPRFIGGGEEKKQQALNVKLCLLFRCMQGVVSRRGARTRAALNPLVPREDYVGVTNDTRPKAEQDGCLRTFTNSQNGFVLLETIMVERPDPQPMASLEDFWSFSDQPPGYSLGPTLD
ncbi:hypothetical protein MG293_010939 [Ovis ammon polii]|uniref:Uncharacterized protein n=1 Tax=Ovis ammon polii TaxID=230172 RepID=A0AAD4U5I1_OVIAM|nr:hypothetical protein MG293_010939 [Ovis ammon polii]